MSPDASLPTGPDATGPHRDARPDRAARVRFVLAFGWLAASFAVAARLAPLPERPVGTIAALLSAGAGWALAVWAAGAIPSSRAIGIGVVAGAVLLRLLAFGATWETSDDRHRYAWEGGLVLSGVSPYAMAPEAEGLASFRERWPETFAAMNNTDVSAAYPPVAQAAFAVAVWASARFDSEGGAGVETSGPWLRALFAGADLLVLLPLAVLLRRRGLSCARLVAWAWCPLVACEFAGASHFDSLGILLLVCGVLAAEARRAGAAGMLLGAAGMVKLLPLALVPFAMRAAGRSRAVVFGAVGVVAVSVGGALMLEHGSQGLGAGISEYALRWEAASLVHRFVEGACASFLSFDEGPFDPRRVARAFAGIAWCAVGVAAWRRKATVAGAALSLFGAFLVLSPTLHPWYVTWVVPFLALRPLRSFVYLACAAPLLYAPLGGWMANGEWVEPAWLWPVVALPFFGLLWSDRRALEART